MRDFQADDVLKYRSYLKGNEDMKNESNDKITILSDFKHQCWHNVHSPL